MRFLNNMCFTDEVASGDLVSAEYPTDFTYGASLQAWPTGNVDMTLQLQACNEATPVNWLDIPDGNINITTDSVLIAPLRICYHKIRVIASGGIGESLTITTTADSSNSLRSTWFKVVDPVTPINMVFWFKIGGSGVDPMVPGTVSVEVDAATNATNATIAAAIVTASFTVTTSLNFNAVSNVITVTEGIAAPGLNATDGATPTHFTFGAINSTGTINVAIKTNGQ